MFGPTLSSTLKNGNNFHRQIGLGHATTRHIHSDFFKHEKEVFDSLTFSYFLGVGEFCMVEGPCRFTDYLQTHVFNYLWCLSNGKIKNVTRPLIIIIFFEVTYSMNSTCKIAIQQLHILQSVVEITNWFRFSQDMQYTWTLDFVVSIEYS